MLTGWVAGTKVDKDADMLYKEIGGEDSDEVLSTYVKDTSADAEEGNDAVVYYCMYDEDKADGHIQKNKWRKTWAPKDAYEEDEDADKFWYWIEKDGKAYIPASADVKAAGIDYELGDGKMDEGDQFDFAKKKINSKDYFFNTEGQMISDFVNVVYTTDPAVISEGMYYFGGSDDGSMKTGSQTIKDDNGDSFKFYFGTKDSSTTGEVKGKGVTGNKNNKLYYMGHLVAAEDYKYQPVKFDWNNDGNDDALFIVNQNGSIQHSALDYKEDGDVLIAGKDSGVEFIKENHDSIWDKYAVKNPAALNGRINVDYLEERDVMPINPTFNPSDSDILSPDSAK